MLFVQRKVPEAKCFCEINVVILNVNYDSAKRVLQSWRKTPIQISSVDTIELHRTYSMNEKMCNSPMSERVLHHKKHLLPWIVRLKFHLKSLYGRGYPMPPSEALAWLWVAHMHVNVATSYHSLSYQGRLLQSKEFTLSLQCFRRLVILIWLSGFWAFHPSTSSLKAWFVLQCSKPYTIARR